MPHHRIGDLITAPPSLGTAVGESQGFRCWRVAGSLLTLRSLKLRPGTHWDPPLESRRVSLALRSLKLRPGPVSHLGTSRGPLRLPPDPSLCLGGGGGVPVSHVSGRSCCGLFCPPAACVTRMALGRPKLGAGAGVSPTRLKEAVILPQYAGQSRFRQTRDLRLSLWTRFRTHPGNLGSDP